MSKKLHKLLFILYLFNFNAAFADNKVELKTSETSQLDQIREALDEFTRYDTTVSYTHLTLPTTPYV